MTHNKMLQNHLDRLRLATREEDEHDSVTYFSSKPEELSKCGIYKLSKTWNGFLGSNGDYLNYQIFLSAEGFLY